MNRLWENLMGTVSVELEGSDPEGVCNRCAGRGLGFWSVKRIGEHRLTMTVRKKDLPQLRMLCGEACCMVTERRERGLMLWLGHLRGRWGFLAGGVALILLCLLAGQFVWLIEVSGNETVPSQVILSRLADYGFEPGCLSRSVDQRDLSNKMLMELDRLSFLTIRIHGMRAEVEVREEPVLPPAVEQNRPADVAAERDGVVLSIRTLSGQAAVTEGQAVRKGQVLISGLLIGERGDGSGAFYAARQVTARGTVWARTRRTLSAATPLICGIPGEREEEKRQWAVEIGKHSLIFAKNSGIDVPGCAKLNIVYPAVLPGGLSLPLSLRKTVLEPWHWEAGQVDAAQAERLLKETLRQRMELAVGEGTVDGMEWRIEERNRTLCVTLTADCTEPIGETVWLDGGSP